ncbi:pyruvate kinase [Micromonospora sp. RP3T]|uniref:pyruvate kinase n=1 Tax=Micromonospora sp. RP3T TaxID=2135446 RepID=UPI000D15A3EB|nr:pyruvate kinase [Micromonospora sp. RP3T]PTA46444.1 pyruvate kinase [Micromonospora sp. RP3T]
MQRAVTAVSTATAAVRRTRIVATIGAASADPACLAALIRAGVDVVRLSMVNGSRERHLATVRTVRAEADRQGRTVSVLADLQGRKNRIGRLRDGAARWEPGEKVVLAAAPGDLDWHRTWLIHGWRAVPQAGSHVLIDDGAVVLRVEEADDSTMTCTVTQGGTVTDGRGVTLPGRQPIPVGLTPRDRDDAAFARHLGADMIALSFTAHPSDREALHRIAPEAALIAKIEHPDAVRALPPLIDAFDGLMVARGDLALEIPFEDVPVVQKQVTASCAARGRSSMVATQLLHSMRTAASPTRAEVADIFNAVLDGADYLVLAGETGFGRRPVDVVDVCRRVIERAERHRTEQMERETHAR